MAVQNNDNAVGTIIGTGCGLVKGVLVNIETSNLNWQNLNWQMIYDTAVLAAVGAVVGFVVTGILKYLKNKFSKLFKR
jgi:hypothetical protein